MRLSLAIIVGVTGYDGDIFEIWAGPKSANSAQTGFDFSLPLCWGWRYEMDF